MLEIDIKVRVYKKDEISLESSAEFDYTDEDAEHFSDEIERLINGVFVVSPDGELFVYRIASIWRNY